MSQKFENLTDAEMQILNHALHAYTSTDSLEFFEDDQGTFHFLTHCFYNEFNQRGLA